MRVDTILAQLLEQMLQMRDQFLKLCMSVFEEVLQVVVLDFDQNWNAYTESIL